MSTFPGASGMSAHHAEHGADSASSHGTEQDAAPADQIQQGPGDAALQQNLQLQPVAAEPVDTENADNAPDKADGQDQRIEGVPEYNVPEQIEQHSSEAVDDLGEEGVAAEEVAAEEVAAEEAAAEEAEDLGEEDMSQHGTENVSEQVAEHDPLAGSEVVPPQPNVVPPQSDVIPPQSDIAPPQSDAIPPQPDIAPQPDVAPHPLPQTLPILSSSSSSRPGKPPAPLPIPGISALQGHSVPSPSAQSSAQSGLQSGLQSGTQSSGPPSAKIHGLSRRNEEKIIARRRQIAQLVAKEAAKHKFLFNPHGTRIRHLVPQGKEPWVGMTKDELREFQDIISRDTRNDEDVRGELDAARRELGAIAESRVSKGDWLAEDPALRYSPPDPVVTTRKPELFGKSKSAQVMYEQQLEEFQLQDHAVSVARDTRDTHSLYVRTEEEAQDQESRGVRDPYRQAVPLDKRSVRRAALVDEVLVPIRIDIEHELYKVHDVFTWNINEPSISVELFAFYLCSDLRVPHTYFHPHIVASMKHQIDQIQPYALYLDAQGVSSADDASVAPASPAAHLQDSPSLGRSLQSLMGMDIASYVENLPLTPDLRIPIKLDIVVGNMQLLDQFEWDIIARENSPECAAHQLCTDLGLPGEFLTAIAHSIREQVDMYIGALFLLGHILGAPVADEELARELLPPLIGEPFRAGDVNAWTPQLNELTPEEVAQSDRDRDRDRERRRRRRPIKRRGVTLPERTVSKTHRTIVPRADSSSVMPFSLSQSGLEPVVSKSDVNLPPVLVWDYIIPSSVYNGAFPPPVVDPRSRRASVKPWLVDEELLHLRNHSYSALGLQQGVSRSLSDSLDVQQDRFDFAHAYREKAAKAPRIDASASFAQGPSRPQVSGPLPLSSRIKSLNLKPVLIEGKWHCANCGCPYEFAMGIRNGPSAPSSLCRACGSYYARLRKLRPVEYTLDRKFHEDAYTLAQQEQQSAYQYVKPIKKLPFPKKASHPEHTPSPAPVSATTPTPSAAAPSAAPRLDRNGLPKRSRGRPRKNALPRPVQATPPLDESLSVPTDPSLAAPSPQSTQPTIRIKLPLRQSGKTLPSHSPIDQEDEEEEDDNDDDDDDDDDDDIGDPSSNGDSPASDSSASSSLPQYPAAGDFPMLGDDDSGSDNAPTPPSETLAVPPPPPWALSAIEQVRANNPRESIELVMRPDGEVKVRCNDCPGKLYNSGPGRSLNNFRIHLLNKGHRSNVEGRLQRASPFPL